MADPQLHVVDDLGAGAGELLVGALPRGGTLAVAGGGSVVPVFRWLADHLPDEVARQLVVTWADERHVPLPASGDWRDLPEDSNSRGAWEHWFSRARVVPELVPMARPGTLEEARASYEADFVARIGRLDAVLLGAGPDGHFASLFPGHAALAEAGPVLAIDDSPKPPPARITLSLTALQDVRCAILVGAGAAKAGMLRRAWRREPGLPLSRYQPRGDYHWVLDRDAAKEIE